MRLISRAGDLMLGLLAILLALGGYRWRSNLTNRDEID